MRISFPDDRTEPVRLFCLRPARIYRLSLRRIAPLAVYKEKGFISKSMAGAVRENGDNLRLVRVR